MQNRTPYDWEAAAQATNGHIEPSSVSGVVDPPEANRDIPTRPASARRAEGFVVPDQPQMGLTAPPGPKTLAEKVRAITAEGDQQIANVPQLDPTLLQINSVANGALQALAWYQKQLHDLLAMVTTEEREGSASPIEK